MPGRATLAVMGRSAPAGSREEAQAFLARNPLDHAKAIESLRRGNGWIEAAGPWGVVVHDLPSDTWFVMARDADAVDPLVAGLHGVSQCEVFPAEGEPAIARRFGLKADAHYVMAVARTGWRAQAPAVAGAEISPVGPSSPDLDLYPESGRAYARARARDGTLWAAKLEGATAGFVGLHDDASMGLLHVLPGWRRRGLGTMLLTRMTARVLAGAPVACSQIEAGNGASIRLHRRAGLQVGEGLTAWMGTPGA